MELRNLPYAHHEQVMMYILTRVPGAGRCGVSTPPVTAAIWPKPRLLAFGPDIIDCVMLSPKWYGEWMPKLEAEFEDQKYPRRPAIRPRLMICAM